MPPGGRRRAARPVTGYLLGLDTEPMEAKVVADLPEGGELQFEPKWDGFRCMAFKAGAAVDLRAKSGKPLARYFPEMEAALAGARSGDFVLDGELVVPRGGTLSFGALQDRVHPAESRVRKLAEQTPALLIVFDCLASQDAGSLLGAALPVRRNELERLAARFTRTDRVHLSPCTRARQEAAGWLARTGGALDGVIAKRIDHAYLSGKRDMLKVKTHRTADCVVGGFRYGKDTRLVGSLLLGLYDADGRLDHVGFTAAIRHAERGALTARLQALEGGTGFTGAAPGGPSRWATEQSAAWQRLRPELVVEVSYDQVTDGKFRHGTLLLRWRPDKAPGQCSKDQLVEELRPGELVQALV